MAVYLPTIVLFVWCQLYGGFKVVHCTMFQATNSVIQALMLCNLAS